MSTFVLMRILESAPSRYDLGMRLLTLGGIDAARARVAALAAAPGLRLLDLGCGTGELSLACAALGADVVAVDRSAGMLEEARRKPVDDARGGHVTFVEAGIGELSDRFPPASFDGAVACLSLSELEASDRRYALRALHRLLKPGGRLVVADEMLPEGRLARAGYRLLRAPLAALTFIVAQSGTRPVEELPRALAAAGFGPVRRERRGGLAILVARRREA